MNKLSFTPVLLLIHLVDYISDSDMRSAVLFCCSLLESAPTLGLKAINLRIISTVKSPVKSMLRMFMALLKLLVCP